MTEFLNNNSKRKMNDAGQESLSAEGGKVASVRGSWTVPLGMYNDVKEQASEMETDISEKQDSSCSKEGSKETVDVKETSSESLQHSEERGSSVAHDKINEQGTVEESSRKHKRKESRDYDGKCVRRLDDDNGERGHRHKDRRRSKSAEDRHHHHHKLREEPVRRKRRRSRESPSRVQSPQQSMEHNDDTFSGKNESSATRDETSTYTSNGRLLDSISQPGFERKPDRKEWEQEHLRKNILKNDYRERSPCRDNERQNARGDLYEETNNDQMHSKRKRSNSPERGKELTHGDRGSRSDRRRQKHRSRSRSRSRHDRHKEASGHQRRGRSKSRSRDNGRNRSKSLLRNNDTEPKPKTVEKRLRSRSREREATPVAAWTNSSVDMQKQSGEEVGWRKKQSRSPSKHSYENYVPRDRENRRSQSRDRPKNWPDNERQADSDYPKRRRSRSRSAERVWNSSNWEDKKRYRDEYSRDDLPNSGSWSSRPERVTNSKYYRGRGDRQSSWTRGEKEDNTILRDQSRENVMPNRWHGNQDHSGNKDRPLDRDRKRDWDVNRHRRATQEDQDVANDNGQQLEDMVTKSLAKLRRDSDREHRGVDEALKDITSGEDKIREKDQRWGEADRSAIPVLLSKKSAYKDSDAYDPPEAEDFNYDQACKEDFIHESNSRNLQPRDRQQPGAPSQQGFPASVKERHLPVTQTHFHGNFREPPPHVRVDFAPRGKALMQPSVTQGQFGIGARMMPGVVQLVAPIHLRPPPMAVDWRMMGPDAPRHGMFPISRPPPHVGPRGQLIQVGGFIRTQMPVEFLARHPLPPGHTPCHPFHTGPLPSNSLPSVHPGTTSHLPLIRPHHPQSDPRQLPPPPPIALLHSSHQLRLLNQEPPRGLVEVRHRGPPPGVLPPQGLVPPHPPPNLAFPPPPLPVKLVGHSQGGHQSLSYPTSNQAIENLDAKSPSTPPPPPPPAVSSAPQDPRLYSIKLLSHKPVATANSTSDESMDSETSSLPGQNESIAPPKPSTKQVWQQQSNSPERPSSALSFGSDYTPQELTDDAYTEALFEEPYSFDERDVMTTRSEKSELNPQQEVSNAMPARTLASTEKTNIVEDAELADICSQTALEDETAQIPEIMNPMASPTVTERLASDKSPSNAGSTNALAAAAVAAHSLQMIEVADLKKVLETVRTTTLSNEEEAKSQDKVQVILF